jgi:membrane protein implicated in regulation of membrane protease activity
MINYFAALISSTDPMWFVFFALLLFLLDWFLLQTEALSVLAGGLLIVAFLDFVQVSPIIQIWSFPVSLAVAYFGQRKVFLLLRTGPTPFEETETHIGQIGVIKTIELKNESSSFFYDFKKSHDNSGLGNGDKEIKIFTIILENGSSLPVETAKQEFDGGEKVRIISVQNGTATVERAS